MSADLIENDLRQAFAVHLSQLPAEAAPRIAELDYHPRTRSRLASGLGVSAALAASGVAVVALTAPVGRDSAQRRDAPAPAASGPASKLRQIELAGYRFCLPPVVTLTLRLGAGGVAGPPAGAKPLEASGWDGWSVSADGRVTVGISLPVQSGSREVIATAQVENGQPSVADVVAVLVSGLGDAPGDEKQVCVADCG